MKTVAITGLWNLPHPLAVRRTVDHPRRRLLEDLGSHTASGKGCCSPDGHVQ